MGEYFRQVSRAIQDGATGPEAFTLPWLLSGHFDRADSAAGYKKFQTGLPVISPYGLLRLPYGNSQVVAARKLYNYDA